jgi:hypothetical protein
VAEQRYQAVWAVIGDGLSIFAGCRALSIVRRERAALVEILGAVGFPSSWSGWTAETQVAAYGAVLG